MPELEIEFYVAAKGSSISTVVSQKITVIVGCFDVNSINSTYITPNNYELWSSSVLVSHVPD
jgi:hypothetical protein